MMFGGREREQGREREREEYLVLRCRKGRCLKHRTMIVHKGHGDKDALLTAALDRHE
jgi:hypothetical protein